jgi:Ribonuclease G/E
MTRKRTRESLGHALTVPCPDCNGQGRIRSIEMLAAGALRQLLHEAHLRAPSTAVTLRVHPDVAAHLLHEGKESITTIEERTGCRVTIAADPGFDRAQHAVEASD